MQGTLHAKPGSILVFIDETGHEEFADPKYPLFGLGGCLFPSSGAIKIVDAPWRSFKQKHFHNIQSARFMLQKFTISQPNKPRRSAVFLGIPLSVDLQVWSERRRQIKIS